MWIIDTIFSEKNQCVTICMALGVSLVSGLALLMYSESRGWIRRFYSRIIDGVMVLTFSGMLLCFSLNLISGVLGRSGGSTSSPGVVCDERAGDGDLASLWAFYDKSFENLLTVLGVLGTVFGIIIPVGAYLFQLQTVKRERNEIQHEVQAREMDLRNNIRMLKASTARLTAELREMQGKMTGMRDPFERFCDLSVEMVRSNLEALTNQFNSSVPADLQIKTARLYINQFFALLRIICVKRGIDGVFSTDISRFKDFVGSVNKAGLKWSDVLCGMPVSWMDAGVDADVLRVSVDPADYDSVAKTLGKIIPVYGP